MWRFHELRSCNVNLKSTFSHINWHICDIVRQEATVLHLFELNNYYCSTCTRCTVYIIFSIIGWHQHISLIRAVAVESQHRIVFEQ